MSMHFKYEPSSEPLHISAKYLYLDREPKWLIPKVADQVHHARASALMLRPERGRIVHGNQHTHTTHSDLPQTSNQPPKSKNRNRRGTNLIYERGACAEPQPPTLSPRPKEQTKPNYLNQMRRNSRRHVRYERVACAEP